MYLECNQLHVLLKHRFELEAQALLKTRREAPIVHEHDGGVDVILVDFERIGERVTLEKPIRNCIVFIATLSYPDEFNFGRRHIAISELFVEFSEQSFSQIVQIFTDLDPVRFATSLCCDL